MDIICINDQFTPEQLAIIKNRPEQDKIYSIREVVRSAHGVGLLLNEVHNPHTGWTIRDGMKFTFEPNFAMQRFAQLDGTPLTFEKIRQVKTSPKVTIETNETKNDEEETQG